MRPNKDTCNSCKWSGLHATVGGADLSTRVYCCYNVGPSKHLTSIAQIDDSYILIGTTYTTSQRFRPNKKFIPPHGCPWFLEHLLRKDYVPKDVRYEVEPKLIGMPPI